MYFCVNSQWEPDYYSFYPNYYDIARLCSKAQCSLVYRLRPESKGIPCEGYKQDMGGLSVLDVSIPTIDIAQLRPR